MIRKDYIIRLIEQFGAIWARLLTQLRAGLLQDARATLDTAYQQLLGLNFDAVRARSSGELLARLQFGVSPADGHERCCVLAARFADRLGAVEGVEVLNPDPPLNQVLVRFGDAGDVTQRVIAGVQDAGVCWMGGTVWRGRAAMRISVSSWCTTASDVDRSVDSIVSVLASMT